MKSDACPDRAGVLMSMDRRSFVATSYAMLGAAMAARAEAAAPGSDPHPDVLGQRVPSRPGEIRDARSAKAPTVTVELTKYIANSVYADLDAATVTKTKHRLLDLVGCAFGGVAAPHNASLVKLVRTGGGAPQASIIGYPVKGPVDQVAMTNAVISRSYDFEVMLVPIQGRLVPSHHSPTTCMTALAVAEHRERSGKDFLTALTVGDDVAARLIGATGMDWDQGWDGVPVFSSLGATAVASKLQGLTAEQVQDALGIVVDTLAGTLQAVWDGASNWKLVQGLAARNSVLAVSLADQGWVGPGDVLLAPYGFYAQYTGGCRYPETLTEGLGKVFYAEEYFKPYPACAATHSAIECALDLRSANGLNPDQIDRIAIRQPTSILSSFVSKPFEIRRDPHCDANFSTRFQVANALLNGSVLISHYEESAIRSPAIAALLQKTSLTAFSDPHRRGVEIEVALRDGRKVLQIHDGDPSHYPNVKGSSYSELVAKFKYQVQSSGFVTPAAADEIVARIENLENEKNMADFVRLLTRTYYREQV